MSAPIITLTSDFGSRDGYVAAMKGVILGICPDAIVVDVSHELPPHDVPHAAFVLGTAFPFFPSNTVHLAVVDPGVGTDRRPILLITPAGAFVAPDNGLLTYALTAHGIRIPGSADPDDGAELAESRRSEAGVPDGCAAYVLDRDRHWLKPTSDTFHGRDIFAPVAAHLATGVRPEDLGTPTPTVQCLAIPQAVERGDIIEGRIIHVDRFGNLVSNIRLAGASPVAVGIAGTRIPGLSHSYAGGREVLALVGSHGYLEVALREGSAAKHLGAGVGARVDVTLG
ncbi:MAG: SAM-dependent chlorinase/fluorinase [Chloroflexi bacterium]|nr:SAM-dependent chlorinase/fluorinase [Chloroflexota bacterium]